MSKTKTNILLALKFLSWTGLVALFVFTSIAAMTVNDNKNCEHIRVIFMNDKNLGFIHSPNIVSEIKAVNPNWKGQKADRLHANLIENSIKKNDYVKSAEVYLDNNNNLNVFVEPKEPIARIHLNNDSYYLSENWDKMPVSTDFSKRVIHVSGAVHSLMNPQNILDSFIEKELKIFLNFTDRNEIWKSIIDQIYITPNGKFELYLSFSEVVIKIGFINHHFENRMEKISNFIRLAPYYKNLSHYSSLDFQYSQQVIASKKETIQN